MRIISLLASATEIVCALGIENQLVGRAHECDFPASIKKLPICAELNFDASGTSREIDENLKTHVKAGHDLYKVNTELIQKLNPELIITQSHCEVCAVSKKDLLKAFGKDLTARVQIVSLQPNRLEDVWSGIREIAKAAQVADNGEAVIKRLTERLNRIREGTSDMALRPRVACIEWIEPMMCSGNWMPELIDIAGGANLFGEAGKHSPLVSWKDLVKANPDFILVVPCGFEIKRTREEMSVLSSKPGWLSLDAVINNRVILLDGNSYFNRPGPRLVDSTEMLAEIYHPELFFYGYKDSGWEYYGIQ